jgi:AhpD family alkylhydroperoxidase
MPRVPVHDLDTAPEASRDDLKVLKTRRGRILNIFGGMAHAPTLLALYMAAEGTIAEHTSLDRKTREAIHLTVANVNDCGYCQSAYTAAATAAGFSQEEAVDIRRGKLASDPALTALLAFAREVAGHKGHVTDATWQEALDHGWTDRQLLEAFADVVRTILTNYFNHLVGTDLDLRPVPEG